MIFTNEIEVKSNVLNKQLKVSNCQLSKKDQRENTEDSSEIKIN